MQGKQRVHDGMICFCSLYAPFMMHLHCKEACAVAHSSSFFKQRNGVEPGESQNCESAWKGISISVAFLSVVWIWFGVWAGGNVGTYLYYRVLVRH